MDGPGCTVPFRSVYWPTGASSPIIARMGNPQCLTLEYYRGDRHLTIVHDLTKIVVMIQVSTAELKSRLGTYLGMVRTGATIDITSYRQSVARLVPAVEEELLIEEPTEPPEALARLDRLPSGRSIPGVAALLAERRRR